MAGTILVINAGSSSLKSSLFDLRGLQKKDPQLLWEGKIEWGDTGVSPRLIEVTDAKGGKHPLDMLSKDKEKCLESFFDTLTRGAAAAVESEDEIVVVAHRVVHGGETFMAPTLIDKQVKDKIQQLFPLAPLHNPANLEGIEIAEKRFQKARQVAVFDTAFFSQLPSYIATYPIPLHFKKEGIRRFGFHGISHEYCLNRICSLFPEHEKTKKITCHIGAGVSVTAVDGTEPVATSMGFTPIEGAMMGKRSGSIDPGILFYLMRHKKMTLEEIEELIQFKSGLIGIAGIADFRDILGRMETDEAASLAYRMFVHRLAKEIGGMVATLKGVDFIAFTGGIGEKSVKVREDILSHFAFLGFELDAQQSEAIGKDRLITTGSSKKAAAVIYCREDLQIASKALEPALKLYKTTIS
ncbi:acetate/propionate family kinase [Estrella lausannensis]|uniref:Acetate kinase n=1 Tax=Estrella lausannensis TaxID=483423 RepID=A0A0H5DR30_9BACT|nr:acetate/propionate family kinase [Estrella lausannensis]CRX38598.1 Acetate kinase [Estrella lausannensis]